LAKKKKCDCHKWIGVAVLLVGFWFLLADLGYVENTINWWTAVFLILGGKKVYSAFFE